MDNITAGYNAAPGRLERLINVVRCDEIVHVCCPMCFLMRRYFCLNSDTEKKSTVDQAFKDVLKSLLVSNKLQAYT